VTARTDPTAKVVLITGAASGIGKACAEHLARRGHQVFGGDRVPATFSTKVTPLVLDINDDDSVAAAIGEVMTQAGRIDVVVNNAGFGIAGSIEDTSIDEAHAQLDTNFFGAVRVIKAALPHMRQQGSGLIVNVASIGGLIALPFQGLYSASKFALEGLSEALRMEVAPMGIHVVLLEPADIHTGFTAARRMVDAAEHGAYREAFATSLAVIESDEMGGDKPKVVARRLAKIIATPAPRLRYMAGSLTERLAVLLKRLLPYTWFAPIIAGHYKVMARVKQ
jgi:NAD(P)-dependent dehydrogenase (short-subunit alcohol dehydrogenase family)